MSVNLIDQKVVLFKNGSVDDGFKPMGELVKKLAEIHSANDPLPTTWAGLKEVAQELGIELKGSGYNAGGSYQEIADDETVHLIPYDSSHAISIMIPALDDLTMDKQEVADLAKSKSYPLPQFYSDMAFDGTTRSIPDPENFLLMRIGEYTTQKCR